jgi:DNA-binding transcriptional ArsR family regulator
MQADSLNDTFFALGDPTRRKIIHELNKKSHTILELSDLFDMTFQAVAKHVGVLEKAKLIQKEKQGRNQICSLSHKPMTEALKWITEHHELWKTSFGKLEKYLEQNSKK